MLIETKSLDIVPVQSDWDNDQDFTSHGDTVSPLPLPADSTDTDTVPKTITATKNSFGGACRKTKFPTDINRSTVVLSSQPAGSEDPDEYEEYFNPHIFPCQSLLHDKPCLHCCGKYSPSTTAQLS